MAATIDLSKYKDRKIDVLAWRGGTSSGEVLLDPSLADAASSGEITTGIQKLAQRFVIALLTESGSAPYNPDLGTNFMRAIRQGRIRSNDHLVSEFILAERTASRYLRKEETDDDPDDEKYGSTVLLYATIEGDSVILVVELRSLAETAEFIIPVPVVV